jgi:hypothetical protein
LYCAVVSAKAVLLYTMNASRPAQSPSRKWRAIYILRVAAIRHTISANVTEIWDAEESSSGALMGVGVGVTSGSAVGAGFGAGVGTQ